MRFTAKGRHRPGHMNGTEGKYAAVLETFLKEGVIAWYKFEGIKLRLADKTFYTPDFFVMRPTGELECHEVKGFMFDDANVKIKVAAETFPFKFFVVRLKNRAWEITEI